MGERPYGTSLDRYPNKDGNYEPGNCRWATIDQQLRNKRTNHMVTAFGETQCLTDWAIRYGLDAAVLSSRIRKGWDIEKAISTPLRKKLGQ